MPVRATIDSPFMTASAASRNSDLCRRVCTAGMLIPVVIAALFFLPNAYVSVLFGAFVSVAAWEWAGLAGLRHRAAKAAYAAVTLVLMAAVYSRLEAAAPWLWTGAVAWWLLALAVVVRYERGLVPAGWGMYTAALVGWLVLVPAWAALAALHARVGPAAVLWVLLLIWVADSAAYFAGRRWGRRRLAARVSPGKSWEGVAAALLAVVVMALGYAAISGLGNASAVSFVLLAVVTVAFSIVGDLMESLFKRMAGVKDSGHILPGHGGVLDRIDSLTAAAPVFALGLALLEIPL